MKNLSLALAFLFFSTVAFAQDIGGGLNNPTAAGGSGTVTSVSVNTANGVSGTVATATTTPAITLTLGAITPSTVNGITLTTGGSASAFLNGAGAYTTPSIAGSALTGTSLASGIISSSLTSVGTISSGTWQGTAIGTSYLPAGNVVGSASPAQGDVLYYTGSAWADLAAGTSGNFLETQGASANPTWAALPAHRTLLTSNTSFYVNHSTGSDSNTCLSSGAACLTISHALSIVSSNYDLGGYTATINVADGTYAENISITKPWVGGSVTLNGDTTTPTSCIISGAAGAGPTFSVSNGAVVTAQGFDIYAPSSLGYTMYASGTGSTILLTGSIYFGGSNSAYGTLASSLFANVIGTGTITFAQNASYGLYAFFGGGIDIFGTTITWTGTPSYSSDVVFAYTGGQIGVTGNTLTGGVSGVSYSATYNGVINGSGVTIPGSAGSTANGGQKI